MCVYVNIKQKTRYKTFSMKNVTMIQPKRNETRKTESWHQQIRRMPRPVYYSE